MNMNIRHLLAITIHKYLSIFILLLLINDQLGESIRYPYTNQFYFDKLGASIINSYANQLYQTGRYPRTFYNKVNLSQQKQPTYRNNGIIKRVSPVVKKDSLRKKTIPKTRKVPNPYDWNKRTYNLDWNRRKYVVHRDKTGTKKNWNRKDMPRAKSFNVDSPAHKRSFNNKFSFNELILQKFQLQRDPLDRNRKKYIVEPITEVRGSRKDEIEPIIGVHGSRKDVVEPTAEVRGSHKDIIAPGINGNQKDIDAPVIGLNGSRKDIVAPVIGVNGSRKDIVAPVIGVNGSRKDEIVNSKYYYEPMNNDLFPFVDPNGKRRNSLSMNEKQQKLTPSKDSSFLQNKVVEGGNDKEVMYSSNPNGGTKPVEFYLTENNGEVKVSHGQAAEKLLDENRHSVGDYNNLRQQEKLRETDRNDYINQVLGRESEEDNGKVSIAGVPYPADNGVADSFHQIANHPYQHITEQHSHSQPPFQPIIEHHRQPLPLHEQEGPIESASIVPAIQHQTYSTPESKFTDIQPEEATYGDNQWGNHQENPGQNEQTEQILTEKIKNFNHLMDKLHRTVTNGNHDEQRKIADGMNGAPHTGHMNWQHNPSHLEGDRYPPNLSQIGPEVSHHLSMNQEDAQQNDVLESEEGHRPMIGHGQNNAMEYGEHFDGRNGPMLFGEHQHPMEFGEHQPNVGHNDLIGFQTAMKLSKAIISSARNVDKPAYDPQYDININGQTLIPEVFEAFSKTNNDLKRRYNSLQNWAITKSTTANEHELRQQIRSLNELSDMVHLVNNLEKDMLKTILKRKRGLGDGMSYKHEVIPNGKDDAESRRFHNPSDVHDLLQYIYDTYIENRTADEIPVVLQAFQKSVTDIVARKNLTVGNSSFAAQNVSKESALITKSLDMLNKQDKYGGVGSYNLDDDALSNFDFEDHSARQGFFGDRVVNAALRDHTMKGDIESKDDRKLTKFVDRENKLNSPIITVKLLKALDLFLDSIEIGRRIKRFRSKVEDVARISNHSVMFTSSMKQSLGELNKQINETLEKSIGFTKEKSIGFTKEQSKDSESGHKENSNAIRPSNNTNSKEPLHSFHGVAISKDELENRSEESYKDKLKALRKELDGDIAEDYSGKAYDENGIYYEHHKDDPNYLSYEKEWYVNNTFPNKEKHIFNPNMNVENFTASVNDTAMVYIDPHSPYEHIPDIHHESLHHDITQASFNEKNITKLNKEALKGQEAYNKTIPYEKLLKEHNDTYHDIHNSWNVENMTQLNKEAAKGQKFYHDQTLNDTSNFDKEVQKIIDSAISEAKNGSDVNSFYYQSEKDIKDHFGEIKIDKKVETPREEMSSMYTALDKGSTNVHDVLSKHQIDKETANATIKYLDQEGRYINNMFYEENKHYPYSKDQNSDKKDNTPQNKTKSTPEGGIIQGDKRDMASHTINSTLDDDTDISQIENLKKLVRHLQYQNGSNETSIENLTQSDVEAKKFNSTTDKVEVVTDKKNIAQDDNKQIEIVKQIEKDFFVTKNSTEAKNTNIKDKPTLENTNERKSKDQKQSTSNLSIQQTAAHDNVNDKSSLLLNTGNEEMRSGDKKNIMSGLYGESEGAASTVRKDSPSDDTYRSEENDYVIKEQENRASQLRQENVIDSASNFNELEKAISEIKSDKKTLDLVHQVVHQPKVEPEKEGDFDKRNMKTDDKGMDRAHKLMEEINSISYVDDDDDSPPVVKNIKREKIEIKKDKLYHKRKMQKRNVEQRSKGGKIERKYDHKNINRSRYHKRKKYHNKGKWRKKEPRIGTKKNEIESKDTDNKESFIDKLSTSQQKIVWHILKRAYHKGQEDQNMTLADHSNVQSEDENPQETLDGLLHNFLSEKPDQMDNSLNESQDLILDKIKEVGNNSVGNSTLLPDKEVGNNSVGNSTLLPDSNSTVNSFVDPYATIRKLFQPKNISSEEVYPAVLTLQGFPTNPSEKDIQPGTLFPSENNPVILNARNETSQSYNDDPNNSNNSSTENSESYEEGNANTYFFKEGKFNKEKSRKLKAKKTLQLANNTGGLSTDVSHELPSIMNHLDKVAKQMSNESAELIKPFNSNFTDEQSSESPSLTHDHVLDSTNSKNNQTTAFPNVTNDQTPESSNFTNNQSLENPCKKENTIVTDGDDIFNLSTDQCVNQTSKEEEDSKDVSNHTETENCKQHFLTFKKNGFTYKVPAMKCPKSENGVASGDVLHMSDLTVGNTSLGESSLETIEKFNTTAAENRFEDCDPMYKTLVDGETEYRVKVGCKKGIESLLGVEKKKEQNSKNSSSTVRVKNGTVDVIRLLRPKINEKIIYKGKNLMMSQDDLGGEKIMINGSNRMIEISYPPEDVLDGFITLKQGNRIYKIPYKNDVDPLEKLPAKSKVSTRPDYLKSAIANSETFKVKDTAITKATYKNGAKVITMEKEKASLSIYYPPKNKTKFNNTGYMVLKENGQTYNIPLDGSKTLKHIGNKTFLGSKAFKNEGKSNDKPIIEYLEHTSPIEVHTGNNTFTIPATVKQVDESEGKTSMKATTDNTLLPVESSSIASSNNDIMRIKERRFSKDDFHYQPKAYKVDKFRHQKQRIEDDPRDDHRESSSRYRNEDEADPNEEEQEEERRKEHDEPESYRGKNDDDEDTNDSNGITDGRLHGDAPNHVEVFPTFSSKGIDLQEFLGNTHQQGSPPSILQDFASHQQDRTPSIENENEDNDIPTQFAPARIEDSEQQVPRDNNNDEKEPANILGDQEPPQDNEQQEMPNEDDSMQSDPIENEQPLEEEDHRPLENDRDESHNDNDQSFFPLKEQFTSSNEPNKYIKKKPQMPPLIVPPRYIAGGVGLQNLIDPSLLSKRPSEGSNMFVTSLKNGENENVKITPVSGSMNPDINDRNRLEDFSTYAMGRSIKSSHKKKQNLVSKKAMKQFVKDILSSRKAKQLMLPPSYNQLQFLRKVRGSTVKQIGYEFNRLQNSALRQYTHPANDKLDNNDKNQLKKLGYTDSEFYKINKQIVGHKRGTPLPEVGIIVNGQKLGNTNLLMKSIPRIQG